MSLESSNWFALFDSGFRAPINNAADRAAVPESSQRMCLIFINKLDRIGADPFRVVPVSMDEATVPQSRSGRSLVGTAPSSRSLSGYRTRLHASARAEAQDTSFHWQNSPIGSEIDELLLNEISKIPGDPLEKCVFRQ